MDNVEMYLRLTHMLRMSEESIEQIESVLKDLWDHLTPEEKERLY